MSEIYLLYSTFAKKDEAISAADALLAARLIACANIVDGMTSLYRWEGAVCREPEALLLAKTSRQALAKAMEMLKSLHPHTLPCIVAYPAQHGFAPFLKWVEDETRGE
jgi:periplasmic divalent cation tolerance protein